MYALPLRPIAAAAAAAVVLSSLGAVPTRTAPAIVPTEMYSVQLQGAISDLAFNTTALVTTETTSPAAAATVASAVGPSEILAVLDDVVIAAAITAATVVGAAAWFVAFPITLPLSYIVAQGISGNPLTGVLGAVLGSPGGTLVAFFGLPFLAVSSAVGGILSPLRNFQAAALASPRAAAAGTPTASAARRPAAQPVGTPRAAAIRPARAAATAGEPTHAAPNRRVGRTAAAHATAVTANPVAAQSSQATPRYAARIASSANNSSAGPSRVTVPVSRM